MRFIFLLVCLTYFASAQKFGAIYLRMPRAQIENQFEVELEAGKQSKSVLESTKRTEKDSTFYSVKGESDCFNLNLGFQKETFCNYQEYEFTCMSCAQEHLLYMIKYYKLRPKSDVVYMAAPWMNFQMIVQRFPIEENLLLVKFMPVDLPKKEYRKLYHSLSKDN